MAMLGKEKKKKKMFVKNMSLPEENFDSWREFL